jgi:hypothetical protein
LTASGGLAFDDHVVDEGDALLRPGGYTDVYAELDGAEPAHARCGDCGANRSGCRRRLREAAAHHEVCADPACAVWRHRRDRATCAPISRKAAMTHTYRELVIDGVLVAPVISYAAMALLISCYSGRCCTGWFARLFSNPSLAEQHLRRCSVLRIF